jgi:hypothetical protein
MKIDIKFSILLLMVLITSCTDVIDVDVPEAKPRLVVEASLDWEQGTAGNVQTILLSLSTPYFDSESINYVAGAEVKVTNNNTSEVFNFLDNNNGSYATTNFVPIVGDEYSLEIVYNNETYTAVETLMPVTGINSVYQSKDQGFNKDFLEVNVTFDDPAGIENFYLLKFKQQGNFLPELVYISDEFTDGNEMHVFYEKEEFKAGDVVEINLYGISKQYYNFIRLLIDQSSDGGPFATIPAELKGNCSNQTTPENYAFGYFRLTEVSKEVFTFQ